MCHRLLVKKIVAMGIHLKVARWVEEFLKNKTFRVKLGGHFSSEGILKCGVLQGSVLGHLLFLIFCNDLQSFVLRRRCKVHRSKKTATQAEVINSTNIKLVSKMGFGEDCEILE